MNSQIQSTGGPGSGYSEDVTGSETAEKPEIFSLSQNYPNPFNPTTEITYSIPKSAGVKIVVYDILAREVAILVYKYQQTGTYKVGFDASRFTSGVYFYKLIAGDFVSVKKMTLVK